VAIIGAGSATFGGGTIVDLVSSPELREVDLTIGLVDIDSAALNRRTKFAVMVKEHYRSSARIESTPDRKEARKSANYVIISVAQRRWDLWEKDFSTPTAFGFRHVFGETAGPGAAFHTLRSLHVMMPRCQDIGSICPEALVLNFTNPESRVCMGISMLTKLRCVGLCHGPFATLERIADILEKPSDEIDLAVAGINHFPCGQRTSHPSTPDDLHHQQVSFQRIGSRTS
jgi:alpha-galactosidase